MKKDILLPVNYNTISVTQRKLVREQYIKIQQNICYYCKKSLDGPPSQQIKKLKIHKYLYPPNFFKYPIHLHHDHNTGMTIGAVHNYCNAVLWEYEDE